MRSAQMHWKGMQDTVNEQCLWATWHGHGVFHSICTHCYWYHVTIANPGYVVGLQSMITQKNTKIINVMCYRYAYEYQNNTVSQILGKFAHTQICSSSHLECRICGWSRDMTVKSWLLNSSFILRAYFLWCFFICPLSTCLLCTHDGWCPLTILSTMLTCSECSHM